MKRSPLPVAKWTNETPESFAVYLILDTNVIVSAYLKEGTPPWMIAWGHFGLPCDYFASEEMIAEYREVLRRPKLKISQASLDSFGSDFLSKCRIIAPESTGIVLVDPKDLCFYEAYSALRRQQEHAYLITGNLRHFPEDDHILSPRQALDLFDSLKGR